MKLSPDKLRQVLRVACDARHSNRAVGRLSNVAANTVRALRDLLRLNELGWDQLKDLDDNALVEALYRPSANPSRKPVPEWALVHEEMQRRDVTLELLWEEYRLELPEGVSYAQYTRLYRQWRKHCKLSLRQIHRPGEMLFVDFCGRTIPIRNAETGDEWRAQVFVGTLGASGYLFATAVASQDTEDWLRAHTAMLEEIGGVPRFIVPDNLKAGVIRHGKAEIVLNRAYQEFSEHYDFNILPARPRKPKDKSLGEIGVQIVQRWVLARLRHQVFFSLEELNQALAHWMRQLNQRTTRTYPKSRQQRFEELDLHALHPLRADRYPYSRWQYQVRVAEDYHVVHHGHRYSVPYAYAHHLVDLRATAEVLDVFCQRRRIASHVIANGSGITTVPDHMPPHHRYQKDAEPTALLEWGSSIGPATHEYVRRNLMERRDFANGLKAIRALRRDVRQEQWHDRLEPACAYALALNSLSYERLHAILRTHADQRRRTAIPSPATAHENLRGAAYYSLESGETS